MTICAALIGGTYFYFAQYLQLAAGLSPLEAGLVMIVPAVAFGVGSSVGPIAIRWLTPAQRGGFYAKHQGFILAIDLC